MGGCGGKLWAHLVYKSLSCTAASATWRGLRALRSLTNGASRFPSPDEYTSMFWKSGGSRKAFEDFYKLAARSKQHREVTPVCLYALRKHVYSNIRNILTTENEKIQIKFGCFSYFWSKHRLSTHNLCFWTEIRKIMYTPVNPSFTI